MTLAEALNLLVQADYYRDTLGWTLTGFSEIDEGHVSVTFRKGDTYIGSFQNAAELSMYLKGYNTGSVIEQHIG